MSLARTVGGPVKYEWLDVAKVSRKLPERKKLPVLGANVRASVVRCAS